jgi:hypothetical protein
VAFTLAIRDTIQERVAKKAPPSIEDPYVAAAEEAEVRREAQLERSRRRAAALRTIYGATPASPGSAFATTQLGTSAPAREDLYLRDADVEATFDGDRFLQTITIEPAADLDDTDHQELCELLRLQLVDAWGDGLALGTTWTWSDAATGMRARFVRDTSCELRFDRYASLARWLDRTRDSIVPLWAVGRPVSELVGHLEPRPGVSRIVEESQRLSWEDLGIGGAGRTGVIADVRDGRVIAVSAIVSADPPAKRELLAELTALFGTQRDDGDQWHWDAARPPVSAVANQPGYVSLRIGAPPED